jgi:two-component system LytT family sensor kinase
MKLNIRQALLIITLVSVVPVIFFNVYYRIFDPEQCDLYLSCYTWYEKTAIDMSFSLFATFSIFFCTYLVTRYLEQKMPWKTTKVGARVTVEFLLLATAAGILMATICHLYWPFLNITMGGEYGQLMFKNIATAIIITTICAAVWEASFLFMEWKASSLHAERLAKENAEARFQTLTNQINPHFLFNSLNALSALVHSDPDKAEEFIDEFAKIYRYVLEVKEQNVVSLKAELGFLDSFMFLQKIRFGDNLKLEKTVPVAMMEYFLPPLALQELIENAIKHNEVSGQRPLTISVQVVDDVLMVANPLQPRKELVQSTGTGLTNLKARYNLFGNKVPAFLEEDGQFIARLPLIEGE